MEKKIINNSIHNWINNNREKLKEFSGKWIAHNEKEVLASAEKGEDLMKILKEKKIEEYTIAHIHPYLFTKKYRILPIRIRTANFHEWSPTYKIILQVNDNKREVEMLVDSGADISLIPSWLGKEIGFELAIGEISEKALGIGGSVNFVMRSLSYEIDGNFIENVPTAWVLDEDSDDIILGRAIIFDKFDIEFKQTDEEIVFKYRGEN